MHRPLKRIGAIVVLAVGLPVASAATLSLTGGALGSGKGTPPTCDSGTPTVAQNVGTASPNTASVVSVDVSGIVGACANGTLKLSVYNATDAVQEATKAIPAAVTPSTVVNVPLTTAVPLKESHFVAVTLQGP